MNERLVKVIRLVEDGSQYRFARKLGCQESTISRICTGQMTLTRNRIRKICETYPSVSEDYLLGLTDDAGEMDIQGSIDRLERLLREKDRTISVLTRQIEILQSLVDAK